MVEPAPLAEPLFDDIPAADLGTIAVRVIVLPPKPKKGNEEPEASNITPLDVDDVEELVLDKAGTPLGSYLEHSKGNRCCVFLVNGQRQDALDNSFIVQDLGFRYLRNRMMIVVDVDGLTSEAINRLMQGSRQGFYKGDIWNAMFKRVVSSLKNDPDLLRLEEEAEAQIAELEGGDEKVKQALDQLIESHHEHGWHTSEGNASSGEYGGNELGFKLIVKDGGVVSLLPQDKGLTADYPVLFSQPASSSIRLRPNHEREISIKSLPSNCWPAIALLNVEKDANVPELQVANEMLADQGKLTLLFQEPVGFDTDQYPVRAKLRLTATFNGVKEPRQLQLRVLIKPDQMPPEPLLLDEPSELKVSSREPIRIRLGEDDVHVRLRWNGKDHLVIGDKPEWQFLARLAAPMRSQPAFNFSEPIAGRFSLLVSPRPEWKIGDRMSFEVIAKNRNGRTLTATFAAEVVEQRKEPEAKKPRLVDSEFLTGSRRKPPYDIKYINRDDYDAITCWSDTSWTDSDPGCFKEPTERTPLTLIINKDMEELRDYKRMLTKTYTETEVERRITKYTSHIAYHTYQMYQASQVQKEENIDEADARRREEIRRVAMTLIKLMEVSR